MRHTTPVRLSNIANNSHPIVWHVTNNTHPTVWHVTNNAHQTVKHVVNSAHPTVWHMVNNNHPTVRHVANNSIQLSDNWQLMPIRLSDMWQIMPIWLPDIDIWQITPIWLTCGKQHPSNCQTCDKNTYLRVSNMWQILSHSSQFQTFANNTHPSVRFIASNTPIRVTDMRQTFFKWT